MDDELIEFLQLVQARASEHAGGDDATLTERTHAMFDARVERLAAARDRLAGELGDDDPRVAALSRRHTHLARVAGDLAEFAEHQREPTKLGTTGWRLVGRVTDRVGTPVRGVLVQVVRFDGDTDIGDPATTDGRGEFSLVFDVRRMRLPDDGAVTVAVRDRDGEQLLLGGERIRPDGGATDVAEIVLQGRPVTPTGLERHRCEATTASGEQCRNVTRPGERFCHVHRGG